MAMVCETRGGRNIMPTSEGSTDVSHVHEVSRQPLNTKDVSAVEDSQLDPVQRGQKRDLDGNTFTSQVHGVNAGRNIENTEYFQTSPEDDHTANQDEHNISLSRKRRRLVQVEGSDTPQDTTSRENDTILPSDQHVIGTSRREGTVHSTPITSLSLEEPHKKPIGPQSIAPSLPPHHLDVCSPPQILNARRNSTPSCLNHKPSCAISSSCSQSCSHFVLPASSATNSTLPLPNSTPNIPSPGVTNLRPQPTYPSFTSAPQLQANQRPIYTSQRRVVSVPPNIYPTSPLNASMAQKSYGTVAVPSQANGKITLGQRESKSGLSGHELSSHNSSPQTSPHTHEPTHNKPRNSPLIASSPNSKQASPVSHGPLAPYLRADSESPQGVSTIINNNADALLNLFDQKIKLVLEKRSVEMSAIQQAHQETINTFRADYDQCLESLKGQLAYKDVQIKTLEEEHRKAQEENFSIQQEADTRDKESAAIIKRLEEELSNMKTTLLATCQRHDQAMTDLRESNAQRESSKGAQFQQERDAWREDRETRDQTQNELTQQVSLWSKRHRDLLEQSEEDDRLRASAEKAKEILEEERKVMSQQIIDLEEEKHELQQRLAAKIREFDAYVEEQSLLRTNQEATRETLEEEKVTLSQRIVKLEAEKSEFDKAMSQVEGRLNQMKALLQQQVEDAEKKIGSLNLAWQQKIEKAVQDEKSKGEEYGYQRGDMDGYQRGMKDGFEKGGKKGFERGEQGAYQRGEKDGYARGNAESLDRISAMTRALSDADKTHAEQRDLWAREKRRLQEAMERLETEQRYNVEKLKEDALKTKQRLDQYWAEQIELRWEKLVSDEGTKREAEHARRATEDAERTKEMKKRETELQAMTKKVALLEQQLIDRARAEASAEAHISALKKVETLEQQVDIRRQANEEDLLLGQNATALGPYSRSEAKSLLERLVYGEKGPVTPESTSDKPCYFQ